MDDNDDPAATGELAQEDGARHGSLLYDDAPKRRAIIRDLVEEHGHCTAASLSERLGVSEMTIRRDIARLSNAGMIRSVHGGAVTAMKEPVSSMSERATHDLVSKRAIGRRAVDLVGPNFVVAFDSGTTTLEVARAIPAETPLSVITNSLPIIDELGHRNAVRLIGIGGTYDPDLEAFYLTADNPLLQNLRVDVLFLAARHITAGSHYCEAHGSAETKRALISIADHVVLVADSSKFEPAPNAMVRVSGLEVCETVITDDRRGEHVDSALSAYRGEVIRVSLPTDDPDVAG